MQIIDSLDKIKDKKIYLTIGNFDGVHKGHQDFLAQVKREAETHNGYFVVVTFIPHPSFVLKNLKAFLINTYEERREMLEKNGVNYLLEIDFNRDFSTLNPREFFDRYLLINKNLKKVFLGHDFSFGANKSGNFEVAKSFCAEVDIELSLQEEFTLEGQNISSSIVREKIKNGEVEIANNLLGREYFLCGRVIKGVGRGKQIGFPTANLDYSKENIIPSNGVYVTKTFLNGMTYFSVTNVGFNPTFNNGREVHIETHLLDFNHDIYGEKIKVSFLKKVRDEKKFSSVNELINQINIDSKNAREFFSK